PPPSERCRIQGDGRRHRPVLIWAVKESANRDSSDYLIGKSGHSRIRWALPSAETRIAPSLRMSSGSPSHQKAFLISPKDRFELVTQVYQSGRCTSCRGTARTGARTG